MRLSGYWKLVGQAIIALTPMMLIVQPTTSVAQTVGGRSLFGVTIPLNVESTTSNPGGSPRVGRILPFQVDPRSAEARARAYDFDAHQVRQGKGQALADRATLACAVTDSIALGETPDGREVREIACDGAPGYVLTNIDTPQVINCVVISNLIMETTTTLVPQCVLPPNKGANGIIALANRADASCDASAGGWAGSTTRHDFYEATCRDGRAYVLRVDVTGGGTDVQSCAFAAQSGVLCRLNDPDQQAQTDLAFRVSRVQNQGFKCDGAQERFVGREAGADPREVVEFSCDDRPFGLIARLSPIPSRPVDLMDCLSARSLSIVCEFTNDLRLKAELNDRLVDAVPNCQVTAFEVGRSTDEDSFGDPVTVTCEDRRRVDVVVPWSRRQAVIATET